MSKPNLSPCGESHLPVPLPLILPQAAILHLLPRKQLDPYTTNTRSLQWNIHGLHHGVLWRSRLEYGSQIESRELVLRLAALTLLRSYPRSTRNGVDYSTAMEVQRNDLDNF
jgi:hypothetical protein